MAYVKADLDQLAGFERDLFDYLVRTEANYEAFYRAVNNLQWEDEILEKVVVTMNLTITHVNAIRGAIGGAKRALSQMEDALSRYCSISHRH